MVDRYTSGIARAGNAALLIAGMIILFFIISSMLIENPLSGNYYSPSQLRSVLFSDAIWIGLGVAPLYGWSKTLPIQCQDYAGRQASLPILGSLNSES